MSIFTRQTTTYRIRIGEKCDIFRGEFPTFSYFTAMSDVPHTIRQERQRDAMKNHKRKFRWNLWKLETLLLLCSSENIGFTRSYWDLMASRVKIFARHLCLLIIPPFFTHVRALVVGLVLVLKKTSSKLLKIKIVSLECVNIRKFWTTFLWIC